jgi:hypothetical protein
MRLSNQRRAITNDRNTIDKRTIGQRIIGLEFDDIKTEFSQRQYVLIVLLYGLFQVDRLDPEHSSERVFTAIGRLFQAARHSIDHRMSVFEIERVAEHLASLIMSFLFHTYQ